MIISTSQEEKYPMNLPSDFFDPLKNNQMENMESGNFHFDMQTVPNDIWYNIFIHLSDDEQANIKSLAAIRSVCQKWKQVFDDLL